MLNGGGILRSVNPHTFSGTVEDGLRRGSTLGYPTVNIPLSDKSISGIFAGTVRHEDREYHAAVFADPKRGVLEAYLLNFDEELYGETITVVLLKKIRESAMFSDDERLKEMIGNDVQEVEKYFSSPQSD